MPRHLFLAVSGHGFGHLTQAALVVNELRRRQPRLTLTVQCELPSEILQRRLDGEFRLIRQAGDIGMLMEDALTVRVEASLGAYRDLHRDWPRRLERQTALLERHRPDLLLADVPYLPLAAAARLELPAVALCSLHWAAILGHYCPATPPGILETMLAAYRSAQVFLRPTPAMPMAELGNVRDIGPLAILGRNRRREVETLLDLAPGQRLVLVALGGVDTPLPLERWPRVAGLNWLVPGRVAAGREDFPPWQAVAHLPFADLLNSCDALLTKPGYGAFTEAACNGVPVLYVERGDWPESPWLEDWLKAHGRSRQISRQALHQGRLADTLEQLLSLPPKPRPRPNGIGQGADWLEGWL